MPAWQCTGHRFCLVSSRSCNLEVTPCVLNQTDNKNPSDYNIFSLNCGLGREFMTRACAQSFNACGTLMRKQFYCLFYLPLGFAMPCPWHDDGTCMVSGVLQREGCSKDGQLKRCDFCA